MKKTKKDNSIFRELTTKGYLGRAQERAKRRKSPWNLILIPLVLFGIVAFSVGQFTLLWQLNTWVFPEHAGRLREFLGNNEQGAISRLLMTLSSLFSAIPLGLMLANCIAWCIPPARHVFDREAKGIKHASFHEAMLDLGKIALFVVPVCLVLGIIGALTLGSLK